MRRIGTMILAVILACAAAACASGKNAADDADDDGSDEMTEAETVAAVEGLKVGLAGTVRAAVAAHPGAAIEAELERDDDASGGALVCEVKILGADGNLWEVEVDPATGRVIESEIEDDPEDVAEAKDVAAKLPAGGGALFERIHRAEKRTGGRAVSAEIEVEDGVLECEISLVKDGRILEIDVPVVPPKAGAKPARPRAPKPAR